MAEDRALHPNRVVGPRPLPKYDGPDLTKPRLKVGNVESELPDLSWMMNNTQHATKVTLDRSSDPKAEAVMIVEGRHPTNNTDFRFQVGFRDRITARNWADTHLGNVGVRENRLRDGGY